MLYMSQLEPKNAKKLICFHCDRVTIITAQVDELTLDIEEFVSPLAASSTRFGNHISKNKIKQNINVCGISYEGVHIILQS